jgi:hypothetical protein
MCVKTKVFLLINFHIHHYSAVNFLCFQENEGVEHDFFPHLFKKNCLRNQMGLKSYLHFGSRRGREYFFCNMLSGFIFIFPFYLNPLLLSSLSVQKTEFIDIVTVMSTLPIGFYPFPKRKEILISLWLLE